MAPVFEEGVRSRDIYLPKGVWLEEGDPERSHVGPVWLHTYPAPLDVLPFFVREPSYVPGAASGLVVPTLMLLLGLAFNLVGVLY